LQRYSEGQVSREMGAALIPQSAQDACEEFRVKAYR
jgi:hypothetical protein